MTDGNRQKAIENVGEGVTDIWKTASFGSSGAGQNPVHPRSSAKAVWLHTRRRGVSGMAKFGPLVAGFSSSLLFRVPDLVGMGWIRTTLKAWGVPFVCTCFAQRELKHRESKPRDLANKSWCSATRRLKAELTVAAFD